MKNIAFSFFTFIDAEKNKNAVKGVMKRILLVTPVIILVLGIGSSCYYYRKSLESSRAEAEYTVDRLVSQIDERLDNLMKYYISIVPEDSVQWILDNTMKEMDYSRYKTTYDGMVSKGRYADYISGFTLVNFSTGWVLNDKGLFEKDDISNYGGVLKLYQKSVSNGQYWSYQDNGGQAETDAEGRRILDINGLSFVLPLPMDSHNTYALLVAGINMDAWQEWHREWESPYDKIVVLDETGSVVYATDDSLGDLCAEYYAEKENMEASSDAVGKVRENGHTYMASIKTSDVLNWTYYAFHDVADRQVNAGLVFVMFMVLLLFVMLGFLAAVYFVYRSGSGRTGDTPASEAHEPDEAWSDKKELEYLKGSIQSMNEDRQALECLLGQQQEKILELFEIRLMRGEVDNDEWEEYLKGLKLQMRKCLATVVIILNLKDEETEDMINEDVICLRMLQKMPAELKAMAWMPPVYNAGTIFAIFAQEDENALFDTIRRFCDKMQEYAQTAGGFHVMMGISAVHTSYRHIRAAYHESINAFILNPELCGQRDKMMAEGMPDCRFYLEDSTSQKMGYDHVFENNVRAAVKALDKQQCYQATDEFCRYLTELKGQENAVRANIYQLRYVNTIMLAAIDLGIDINKLYPDGIRMAYMELLEVAEPDRVRRLIKWKFIDPVIKERLEYLEKHSETMVKEIERMIAEKNGNISLSECAEALGVHSTYIWKVLKMERNKSFSDYIEEYKLMEAKRLLLETELTVAEIAEKLNYTNAQNFIRFFNKGIGVTPGKYRKLY